MKRINLEDVVQVCIGSAILATPIAFTEEAWKMSHTLPTFKVFLIFITSILLNASFIFYGVYEGSIKGKLHHFTARIIINYSLTAITVIYILYLLNLLLTPSSPEVWISRVVLVSFPASLAGAVIDSFDKE